MALRITTRRRKIRNARIMRPLTGERLAHIALATVATTRNCLALFIIRCNLWTLCVGETISVFATMWNWSQTAFLDGQVARKLQMEEYKTEEFMVSGQPVADH